jgi:hypothetical protein
MYRAYNSVYYKAYIACVLFLHCLLGFMEAPPRSGALSMDDEYLISIIIYGGMCLLLELADRFAFHQLSGAYYERVDFKNHKVVTVRNR